MFFFLGNLSEDEFAERMEVLDPDTIRRLTRRGRKVFAEKMSKYVADVPKLWMFTKQQASSADAKTAQTIDEFTDMLLQEGVLRNPGVKSPPDWDKRIFWAMVFLGICVIITGAILVSIK